MFYHLETYSKVDHIIPVKESGDFMLFKFKDIKSIYQVLKVGNYNVNDRILSNKYSK